MELTNCENCKHNEDRFAMDAFPWKLCELCEDGDCFEPKALMLEE